MKRTWAEDLEYRYAEPGLKGQQNSVFLGENRYYVRLVRSNPVGIMPPGSLASGALR